MKKTSGLFFVLIMFALLAVAGATYADVFENFNSAPTRSSYVNWTYNGFHADSCICDTLGSGACGGLLTKAVRMRNISTGTRYAQLEYVGADSLGKDGGVGRISFHYKSWANTNAAFVVS
jgi:hypothetical protein